MPLVARLAAAATFLGLGTPGGAVAQDMHAAPPGYVLVVEDETFALFLHLASIPRGEGFVEARGLWNYAIAEPDPDHLSAVVLMRYDCAGWRSGEVTASGYSLRGATGELVYRDDIEADPKMEPVAPGSLAGDLLESVYALGGASGAGEGAPFSRHPRGMYAVPPGYVRVTESKHATFFVHADSVRREEAFLEAWEIRNSLDPGVVGGTGGTPYRSDIALTRFDCAGRRQGTIESTAYAHWGGTGDVVISFSDADPNMRPVPSGAPADVLDFFCGLG